MDRTFSCPVFPSRIGILVVLTKCRLDDEYGIIDQSSHHPYPPVASSNDRPTDRPERDRDNCVVNNNYMDAVFHRPSKLEIRLCDQTSRV